MVTITTTNAFTAINFELFICLSRLKSNSAATTHIQNVCASARGWENDNTMVEEEGGRVGKQQQLKLVSRIIYSFIHTNSCYCVSSYYCWHFSLLNLNHYFLFFGACVLVSLWSGFMWRRAQTYVFFWIDCSNQLRVINADRPSGNRCPSDRLNDEIKC